MTSAQILELTPESIASLESEDIPHAVTAAIELDRDIKACTATLDLFKARFIREAQAECKKAGIKYPPTNAAEASSWVFHDPAGEIVRVSFPQPQLVKGFWIHENKAYRWDHQTKQSIPLGNIEKAAGPHFKKLFTNSIFKPVKGLRVLIGALLSPSARTKLLDMLELPSSPRVTFGTAASPSASEEE